MRVMSKTRFRETIKAVEHKLTLTCCGVIKISHPGSCNCLPGPWIGVEGGW